MSNTKCPHCKSTSGFESNIEEVTNYNFKLLFIRCKSCKCLVQMMEYFNAGALIKSLAKKMNINLD